MTAGHLFTLDDANRTLPYVRRVVTDLVRDYRDWQDTLAKYELAAARRRAAEGSDGEGSSTTTAIAAEAVRLEKRAALLATAIEAYLAEITSVGAEVKDFAEGLIDFPGVLDGKSIRWCWMLGEPAVEHWHDTEAGFAGRQPVASLANVPGER